MYFFAILLCRCLFIGFPPCFVCACVRYYFGCYYFGSLPYWRRCITEFIHSPNDDNDANLKISHRLIVELETRIELVVLESRDNTKCKCRRMNGRATDERLNFFFAATHCKWHSKPEVDRQRGWCTVCGLLSSTAGRLDFTWIAFKSKNIK